MKRTILTIVALFGLVTLTPAVITVDTAHGDAIDEIRKGKDGVGGNENNVKAEDGIKNIINALLYVLGAVAVIVLIFAGFRYVTSNGDPGATKAAKDTILYAVVGIIVAILAYAIVNFALDIFKKS